MRLDKYLCNTGLFSRSEASKLARRGEVTVDGEILKDASKHIDETSAKVCVGGVPVEWKKFHYIMLNKPEGYVSSTEDRGPTVMELLPSEYTKLGLAPCGRLDRDTVGLLLITNDGASVHELLAPKKHVAKTYRYRLDAPLSDESAEKLRCGIDLGDFVTKPAELRPDSPTEGEITITEGKFHQIKRMFHAVGCEITFLERVSFGALTLDRSLERGEWRELTDAEIASITTARK